MCYLWASGGWKDGGGKENTMEILPSCGTVERAVANGARPHRELSARAARGQPSAALIISGVPATRGRRQTARAPGARRSAG